MLSSNRTWRELRMDQCQGCHGDHGNTPSLEQHRGGALWAQMVGEAHGEITGRTCAWAEPCRSLSACFPLRVHIKDPPPCRAPRNGTQTAVYSQSLSVNYLMSVGVHCKEQWKCSFCLLVITVKKKKEIVPNQLKINHVTHLIYVLRAIFVIRFWAFCFMPVSDGFNPWCVWASAGILF